LEGSA